MIYNIFYSVIIIISIIIFLFLKKGKSTNRFMLLCSLYIYHLFFAYIYYLMTFSNNADSIQYYFDTLQNIKNFHIEFSLGTYFIKEIVYFLIKYLHMSYFNTTILFASFSFIGFYILFNMVENKSLSKYYIILFFLPNIHFWTVGLGKDSLIFLPLVLVVSTLKNKHFFALLLSILLIFMIRPHIAFLLVVSLGLMLLLFSKIKIYQKLFLSVVIISVIFAVMQTLLTYIGLSDINPEAVSSYIDQRQGYNTQGGSSINIRDYNIVMKVFSFLFRPMFESLNPLSLIVSVENIIYLWLVLYIVKNKRFLQWTSTTVFNLLFIVIFTLLMSNMTSNLGIAVRQKTMLIPMFFYFFIQIYNRKKTNDAK